MTTAAEQVGARRQRIHPLTFVRRKSVRSTVWITAITIVVAFGSILLLFPVAFMISTSLKTSGGAFSLPMKWVG